MDEIEYYHDEEGNRYEVVIEYYYDEEGNRHEIKCYYDEEGNRCDLYEIEYYYDEEGNRYEIGPSFIDGPTGGGILSCPICRACKHQTTDEKYQPCCELLELIPYEIDMGYLYECELYDPDKNSMFYGLVQELMKRGKKLDKPWDFNQ